MPRLDKQILILKFLEKTNQLVFPLQQPTKQIRISDSPIEKYRNDIIMGRLWKRKKTNSNSQNCFMISSNQKGGMEHHISVAKGEKCDSEKKGFSSKHLNDKPSGNI